MQFQFILKLKLFNTIIMLEKQPPILIIEVFFFGCKCDEYRIPCGYFTFNLTRIKSYLVYHMIEMHLKLQLCKGSKKKSIRQGHYSYVNSKIIKMTTLDLEVGTH